MTKVLNIAIAVLLLSALLFGYFSFIGRDDSSTDAVTGGIINDTSNDANGGSPMNGATEEDEKFVALLNELDQISLDVGFLSGAVFNSLRDFTRDLPSQTKGRRNPFAPLSFSSPLPAPRSSSNAGNQSSNSSAPADDEGADDEGADASEGDFF